MTNFLLLLLLLLLFLFLRLASRLLFLFEELFLLLEELDLDEDDTEDPILSSFLALLRAEATGGLGRNAGYFLKLEFFTLLSDDELPPFVPPLIPPLTPPLKTGLIERVSSELLSFSSSNS